MTHELFVPMVAEEVAARLGKTPATLRYDICRHPERVPRHFKLPGCRTPLWHPATVAEFMLDSAAAHGALPKDYPKKGKS